MEALLYMQMCNMFSKTGMAGYGFWLQLSFALRISKSSFLPFLFVAERIPSDLAAYELCVPCAA